MAFFKNSQITVVKLRSTPKGPRSIKQIVFLQYDLQVHKVLATLV